MQITKKCSGRRIRGGVTLGGVFFKFFSTYAAADFCRQKQRMKSTMGSQNKATAALAEWTLTDE